MRKDTKKYYEPLAALAELANLAAELEPKVLQMKAGMDPENKFNRGVEWTEADRARAEAIMDEIQLRLVAPCAAPAERALGFALRPFQAYWTGLELHRALRQLARGAAAELSIVLAPDRERRIQIRQDVTNVILQALEDRDVSRIRECPVCGNILIALRKDQQACRGACTNANNARLFRKRERDEKLKQLSRAQDRKVPPQPVVARKDRKPLPAVRKRRASRP